MVELPPTIDRPDAALWLERIYALPYFRKGSRRPQPPSWVMQLVLLEVEEGELLQSGDKTLALVSCFPYWRVPFVDGLCVETLAHFLIRKPLLLALHDLLVYVSPKRGRVYTGDNKLPETRPNRTRWDLKSDWRDVVRKAQ